MHSKDNVTALPVAPPLLQVNPDAHARWTSLFGAEAALQLAELRRVADDPVAFAALRHRILDTHMRELPAERRENLLGYQDEIEALRAVSGSPVRAFNGLMQTMSDHLEAITRLQRRIRQGHS